MNEREVVKREWAQKESGGVRKRTEARCVGKGQKG